MGVSGVKKDAGLGEILRRVLICAMVSSSSMSRAIPDRSRMFACVRTGGGVSPRSR